MPSVGLAIPLFNEVDLVDAVVPRYQDALRRCSPDWTLVLVDNGSTDGTRERVEHLSRAPHTVAVHLAENAGYGGGIQAGLDWLRTHRDPDRIGWAWGDGQVDPLVLVDLMAAMDGGAGLAKARRVERQDGWRRVAITTAYGWTTRALGVATPDVNGCPKLLTRAADQAIQARSRDWFLDAEVVVGAEAAGIAITGIDATMAPRPAGVSKVNWRTVAEFALNLARWRAGRFTPRA